MELPLLPILTKDNILDFSDWHSYYKTVYGHDIISDVDLNKFTWFYWYSPLGRIETLTLNNPSYNVPLNNPFIFTRFNDTSPEINFSGLGFFVKRDFDLTIFSESLLEVHRTSKSVFEEVGVAWFYLTVGSGFQLKSEKEILIVNTKDFHERNPFPTMKDLNIKVIVVNPLPTGLIEVIYCLEENNTHANTADIPMYHGSLHSNVPYKHKYDTKMYCLEV